MSRPQVTFYGFGVLVLSIAAIAGPSLAQRANVDATAARAPYGAIAVPPPAVAEDRDALPDEARQVQERLRQATLDAHAQAEARIQAERETARRELQLLVDKSALSNRNAEAAAVRREIERLNPPAAGSVGTFPGGPVTSQLTSFSGLRGCVGQSFPCVLTGTTSGIVWGSEIYTDDSNPGAAAVHAGLVQPGEQRAVLVRNLKGQDSYVGSTRHGVVTNAYGHWDGSFTLEPLPAMNEVEQRAVTRVSTPNWLLHALRGKTETQVLAQVAGSTDGTIWGDAVYTDDSPVGVAAVHAGVLRAGETAFVRLITRAPRQTYAGSTRNGVTSSPYGPFGGCYEFMAMGNTPMTGDGLPLLPALMTFRGQVAATLYVKLTGSTTGILWGSDVYSDDSDIATAAVHAGVLKAGDPGIVQITILTQQPSFSGTTRNGVTTQTYGPWPGSFRIERAPEGANPTKLYSLPAPPASEVENPNGPLDCIRLR